MNPDESAREIQNTAIRRFAQAHGFSWNQAQPHLVGVDLLSFSKTIPVDLSAVDPAKFLDVVLNRVFFAGKLNGERDFRARVVEAFTVRED